MNDVPDDIVWMLCAGTIGFDRPIDARVEAARAAGCTRVGVSAPDVAREAAEGTPPEELGRRLRDAGLEVVMDPAMHWCGSTPLPGPYAEFSSADELRMCEALGVVAMTAIGPFVPGDVPEAELPARFAALCDRAASFGARAQFEFMPFSVVDDLEAAWSIVEAADRPNGGLVFDTWHFFRSRPDYSLLEQIPGDRITCVQVSDGAAEPRADLREETLDRLLPGDGAFDLARVLRVLDRIGALGCVGAEVISPTTAAMPPADAATLATDRVRSLVVRIRAR